MKKKKRVYLKKEYNDTATFWYEKGKDDKGKEIKKKIVEWLGLYDMFEPRHEDYD